MWVTSTSLPWVSPDPHVSMNARPSATLSRRLKKTRKNFELCSHSVSLHLLENINGKNVKTCCKCFTTLHWPTHTLASALGKNLTSNTSNSGTQGEGGVQEGEKLWQQSVDMREGAGDRGSKSKRVYNFISHWLTVKSWFCLYCKLKRQSQHACTRQTQPKELKQLRNHHLCMDSGMVCVCMCVGVRECASPHSDLRSHLAHFSEVIF